jgi:chemotaxis protein methyltransferase CheR
MRDADCVGFLQWALPRLERRWAGYRKVRGLVCKRLRRRLRELTLADLDAYERYLCDHAEEWARLDALCAIPISRFYRDRSVFGALEHTVLPILAHAAAAQLRTSLACWSAGCASGEEPYSLALLWEVRLQPWFPGIGLRVLATDSDAHKLARARTGRYAAGSLRELPADLRAAGLEPADGEWRVRDRFRAVQFLQQDLRQATPAGPFDLVFCRNVVLTYYAPAVALAILDRIVDRLRPGGAFVVGLHELLPEGQTRLSPWPGTRGLYRRA